MAISSGGGKKQPQTTSGVPIKDLDPSDTGKMCKANADSKKTALLVNSNSNTCEPVFMGTANVVESAVTPGATGKSNNTTSSGTTSGSEEAGKTKVTTFHQYVTNTSSVKVYMIVYFDYFVNTQESKLMKGQLIDSYISDLSCKRSSIFADSSMSANISLHEEYEFYDLTEKDKGIKHSHIFDIFQLGNIVDFIVKTKVKYNNDSEKKEDAIKFEEKTFLLQRGAVSGYNTSRNANGSSTLTLDIEPIDIYARKVNVYISPHPQENILNEGLLGEVAKKNKKSNNIVKSIKDKGNVTSTLITYISKITELLTHAGLLTDGKGGRAALTALYTYIGSCFSVGEEGNQITRQFSPKQSLFSWLIKGHKVSIRKNAMIGVVAGNNDPLLRTKMSAIFTKIVEQLKTQEGSYSYANLFNSIGIPQIHEIYYDPFVELDNKDKTFSEPAKNTSLNQIPVYSNVKGEKFYFEEIYKPSLVHRNKPILTIFKKKDKKAIISDQNGMHIYFIENSAILNISIKANKDNIKTGIFFKDQKRIEGVEEQKSVVLFGTNLLEIDLGGYITMKEFKETEYYKRYNLALIGVDGHFGEASITCIYSPVRAGCVVYIPFMIKDKDKNSTKTLYAKGYISHVTENFSASGDATMTLELIYLNYTSISLLMGLTKPSGSLSQTVNFDGEEDKEQSGESDKKDSKYDEE